MKQYEMLIILSPELDPSDDKKRDQLLKKFFGSVDLEIKETKTIGKKILAYPIRKQAEGIYVQVDFLSDSLNVKEIDKNVKLIPEIYRYLITVKT